MRTAIITGATRGIGRGIAARLASQGTNIATIYHADEASADALKRLCEEKRSPLFIERLDVRDFGRIPGFVGRVAERFGMIDYLVNNVGADIFKTIDEVSFDEWKASQDLILNAPFIFCKEVLPHMRKARFGRIINIGASSRDYIKGQPGLGPFAVHKAALTVLTKTLALEEIGNGITVNMVAPGSTARAGTTPEELRIPVEGIPIGRRVEIEEVVEAVMYFLSVAAGSSTGQVIGVNGGLST